MPVRAGEHVIWLTGCVVEKLFGDLVSMLETIRGNPYMLTVEDSFSRYRRAYPIPNKEAHRVAKILMDQHFNIYGLPDQLYSDNGKKFVNNLQEYERSARWKSKAEHSDVKTIDTEYSGWVFGVVF